MSNAWAGNWRERVAGRIVARGHQTVTSFVDSSPKATLFELAHELGEDVAHEQLLRLYREEATADRALFPAFARSMLARRIFRLMPGGWARDTFDRVHLYGAWSTDVGEDHYDAVDRVLAALDDLAPRGWIPTGPDDPLLLKAFDRWA